MCIIKYAKVVFVREEKSRTGCERSNTVTVLILTGLESLKRPRQENAWCLGEVSLNNNWCGYI